MLKITKNIIIITSLFGLLALIVFLIIYIMKLFFPLNNNYNYYNQPNNNYNYNNQPNQNEFNVYLNYPPGTFIYRFLNEDYRSYSSFWNPLQKNSTLDSPYCWSAKLSDMNQWINIRLNLPITIAGVVIRGRGDFPDEYVKSFKVNYINSSGNTIPVDNSKIYNSNLTGDSNQISYILFTIPVYATNIIILPQTWNKWISLRADLLISDT